MTARTERLLAGHKVSVVRDGDDIVLDAYTDTRPVTRLRYLLSAEDAQEIASWLVEACCATGGRETQP